MNKYIKYVIIIIVLIGVFSLINYLLKPDMDTEIKNYLIKNGYTETEYEGLLEKVVNVNQTNSFSLFDYTYMINSNDKIDGMNSSLNATYNFKNENIIYSYRINYNNSANIYFKGTYSKDNFMCEKEFSNEKISEIEKNRLCNLIELNVKKFESESKLLFTKYKFIDYIKNKKID